MTIIGIDLGTTNSAVAVWKENELVQCSNRLGKFLTPSIVGLDEQGNVVVGEVAKERLISYPEKTVSIFKRLMGTEHRVILGKKSFSAPELSSLVIKSLIEDAEHFLDKKVSEVVISVPAYFNENQRAATKLAGELAGVTVKRLINEPTAAAMAYGLDERAQGTFMILDMGGGTFDVSILEYFDGVMEVHASAGNNYLGGEDIVDSLVDSVLSELAIEKKSLSSLEKHQLFQQMENVKKNIETFDGNTIELTLAKESFKWSVTQQWFSQVVTPILLKVKQPIIQALSDAQMRVSDIDEVILVGGATRLKLFKMLVAKLFGRLPSCNVDPDLVVSIGAGIQAGLIGKNSALEDIVLTDVCPYTLGTEIQNEHGASSFMPIIERNSTVPISIERGLVTVQDNQELMTIKVYQGEHRNVQQNVFLGMLTVKVPRNKAAKESVIIRYSYDMSGLLEVDATVQSTGKKYNKIIENAPGALSQSEIEASKARLQKLKFHPREDEVNKKLIAQAERIFATSIGQKREEISRLLGQFEAVLNNQNPIEIAKAVTSFEKVLEQFEQEDWV